MNPHDIRFFTSSAEFRDWLEEHHASEPDVWVGFHRRSTGLPSPTWEEAVDAALSYGWIDGIGKGVDATSYTNRFTPRRPTSNWVTSAKQEATRERRLAMLIEASAAGRRVAPLTPPERKPPEK